MRRLGELVRTIINLRESGQALMTLLAVCPNSSAVLEAAIVSAAENNMPMLFAATLNQVDRDGGYTGWTQQAFTKAMAELAQRYNWRGPLYPCLDHGGPWQKDMHTIRGLGLDQTMGEVKASLTASLQAGYRLLHIDPTVDRTLPAGVSVPLEIVVERTVELIAHAEAERGRLGLPPVDYEVGTEEVHGGLTDLSTLRCFIQNLHEALAERDLLNAWPCFIVAQVGTDLHTTTFDPNTARQLYEIVAPFGSLIKGHYTDWVENPEAYPETGMGGANVGPEFTAEEYLALADMTRKEADLCRFRPGLEPSGFMQVLEQAVIDSGRWKKWLLPHERGSDFRDLTPERRDWLTQTGARYIWTNPKVVEARRQLYDNLQADHAEPAWLRRSANCPVNRPVRHGIPPVRHVLHSQRRAQLTLAYSSGGGCAEYSVIQVLTVAGLERLTLFQPEGAPPIGRPFCPQEEHVLCCSGVQAMSKFIQVRDKEDLDTPFQQGSDDLTGNLGALPFVGSCKGFVKQHHRMRREMICDHAHSAKLFVKLAALHGGIFFTLIVRK